jgi:hypothetical protein
VSKQVMPSLNRRVHGALKLKFINMAVSTADLPAAETDRRNLQVGSSEGPELHGRPLLRRASLYDIATAAQRTIVPAMSRFCRCHPHR